MTKFFLAAMILLINIPSVSQVQQAWVENDVGDFFDDPGDPALVLDNNENVVVGLNTRVPNFDTDIFGDELSTFHISKFRPDGAEVFGILEGVSSSLQKHLIGVAVDHSGNIYCVVRESWTVDPVHAIIAGRFAVYKYSPAGAVLWRRNYTDGQLSFPSAIALDPAGNVYVTGFCKESGAQVTDELPDYLTVKWNTSGTFQWARRYDGASPGEGFNVATDIVVDGSGNVYITGASQRDGQIGYATIKYNTSGTELWVQRYTGTGSDDDRAEAITIDINGFVYVTGRSEGTVATIKYNNDGAQLWVQRKGTGGTGGRAIKVDAFGNVYVLGKITSAQAALVKYRFDGFELWTAAQTGNLYSLVLDASGNPYIAGTNSSGNGLAQKYFNSGSPSWIETYASVGNEGIANPIAVAPNDNVYVINFIWRNCSGCGTPRYVAGLIKYTQCTIICPQDITINTDPGQCTAAVNYNVNITGDCGNIAYSQPSGTSLPVGTTIVAVVSLAAGQHCSFNVTVVDNERPFFTNCPISKTVNMDPGVCYASAASVNAGVATATDNCSVTVVGVRSDGLSLTDNYPGGITTITWTATDASNNAVTCSQTITIVDNQPPTIACPANLTVQCATDVPAVNINAVTASDNCSVVVTHVGDVITNQTCANRFTLTRTYRATDPAGLTTNCNQIITVYDNIPPQIMNLNSSQQILWPPDHTMRDITVSYSVSDNCVTNLDPAITIRSNEPVNGTADGDTDPDWEIIDDHHIRLRAERAANGAGRIYTITITIDDGCNPPVSSSIEVRITHNIKKPHSGQAFIVGSVVSFEGEFWDKPGNKHTAKWLIDGSATAKATVAEPSGNKNGKVTGSYKFSSPGVYKLQMNVTDQNGITTYANTNGDLEAIVVIYDPNGGHTYGGGYFDSPAGALTSDPSATGKASYGFAMNYFKNSTYPKGETQFEFKVGDFEFNALNFDYLVISSSMAQFKGTGKIIGGQSGIGFTMTVVDGQLDGTGADKIRMKIYNKNNGSIIYDNQSGASDAALPTQAVGSNSTIVISGTNSSLTKSGNTPENAAPEVNAERVPINMDILAFPNPSANNFSIMVQAGAKEKLSMQVTDMYGRIIETRSVIANSLVRFGDQYRPGTYFVRILHGNWHKVLKLVKLSD